MKKTDWLNKKILLLLLVTITVFSNSLYAQTELTPWGNITGIRNRGQLFTFETSMGLIGLNVTDSQFTGKEMQRRQSQF